MDAAIYDHPVLAALAKELAPSSSWPLELLLPRLLPLNPGTKRPYTGEAGFRWIHGPFNNRRATVATLLDWVKRYPGCDWAVRTGKLSDGDDCLLVIDVDKPGHPGVPEPPDLAWVRQTPNGHHIYARTAFEVRSKTKESLDWGELKGWHSYVQVSPDRPAAADFGVKELGMLPASLVRELGLEPVDARKLVKTRRRTDQANAPAVPLGEPPKELGGPLRHIVPRRALREREESPWWHGRVVVGRNSYLFNALMKNAGHNVGLRGDVERQGGMGRWYNEPFTPGLDSQHVRGVANTVTDYSSRWEEEGHTPEFIRRQRRKAYLSHEKRRQNGKHEERNERIRSGRDRGVPVVELARQEKLSVRHIYRILAPRDWTAPPPPPVRRAPAEPELSEGGEGGHEGRDPPAGRRRGGNSQSKVQA